jgi:hypothetical protein
MPLKAELYVDCDVAARIAHVRGDDRMIVVHDYRGHRIEITAAAVDGGRYNATVRLRRLFSQDKPRVETVTCLKLRPDLAEHTGEIYARRWVDLHS